MNTAEKIVNFLRKHQGSYFCDDCIAQALRLRTPQPQMTEVMSRAPGNLKELAICERCGEQKLSTMFAPGPKCNAGQRAN